MVHVSLVSHRDVVGDLVQLFNLVFSARTDEDTWTWKHIANPLISANPQIVVATDGKKVVGARPLMLANLRFQGETFISGQPCDTMVHPDYRRQGVFTRMNHLMIRHAKDLGLALFYNFPNQYSKPGNLKQGWKEIFQVERLYRLEDPVKVAGKKMGEGFPSKVLGTSYRLLFGPRAKKDEDKDLCPPESWRIKSCNRADKRLEVLNLISDKGSIELDRSLCYLSWRIDHRPEGQSRYVMCLDGDKSDELLGYALVSVSTDKDGIRTGQIVDHLISARARGDTRIAYSLFCKAVDEMVGLGSDVMHAWAGAGGDVDYILRNLLGFKSLSEFPLNLVLRNQPLSFLVREVEGSWIWSESVENPALWRLTPLFYDTV